MKTLNAYLGLGDLPKTYWIVGSYLAIALIGLIDYFSGPRVPLGVLYLPPVCAVAWFVGRTPGIVCALVAAGVALAATFPDSGGLYVSDWLILGATRVSISLLFVFLLSELQRLREPLEELVRARTLALQRENTKRKEAEAVAMAAAARSRVLFQNAPIAYFVFDQLGGLLDMNSAAESLLGYRKVDLVGETLVSTDMFFKDELPRVMALLTRNTFGQPAGVERFRLRHKDGREVATEFTTHPVKTDEEVVVLVVAWKITDSRESTSTTSSD